jgi:integrase
LPARNDDDGTPSVTTAPRPGPSPPASTATAPAQPRLGAGRCISASSSPTPGYRSKRRHVRATTAYRYSWFVERYINPTIGEVPLRRLRADHLDGLYDRLTTNGGHHGTGLAPKTVHEVHMILRSSLDLAVRRQLVEHNVAHDTHARRRQPTGVRPRSWTAQELADFLNVARPQRLYPALHLAAFTGMRRGEVVGLKWSDLDKQAKRLSTSPTLQNVAGNPVEFDVKTRTSRRGIDLDDNTMEVLVQWRQVDRDGLPHR